MPLGPTPHEAALEAPEFRSAAELLAELDLTALDVEVKIHELLARFHADLHAVEEAIHALELSAGRRSKRFRGSSRSLPGQSGKVVEIHSRPCLSSD